MASTSVEHHLEHIRHYLPSQLTLKDFVHHNSLHAFQKEKFYEGIFRASKAFGYKVTLQLEDYRRLFTLGRIRESVIERIIIDRKGVSSLEEWSRKVLTVEIDESFSPRIGQLRRDWKRVYKIDIDTLVHPLLYRILCAYLDQGVSTWDFPLGEGGLLDNLRRLERNCISGLFHSDEARQLFLNPSVTTEEFLSRVAGDEKYHEQYLFDMLFSHRGWSGMVATMEDRPETLLLSRKISLKDLVHLELAMEYDMLIRLLGKKWKPISAIAEHPPIDILHTPGPTESDEVLKIWQDAFEWSYYDDVFEGIKANQHQQRNEPDAKRFQAIFCIDERECSLRRHVEYIEPACETFGAPGFFGVEFYYKQAGAQFLDKLCPAPVTPTFLVREMKAEAPYGIDPAFEPRMFSLSGGFVNSFFYGFIALGKLIRMLWMPRMSPSISDAFSHMDPQGSLQVENSDTNEREQGLQVGFTIEEMTLRVGNFLRGIGLTTGFAELVYVMAHGSSSANNPHHGAHDCGACSGRPGAINARVFCTMANHAQVRHRLVAEGIVIPDDTHFLPAMHDTAADQIGFFDEQLLDIHHAQLHLANKPLFEAALDLNAKERSRRFASIDTRQDLNKVRKAIHDRSVSLFEPRPELGHGTNALCIVGRRSVTKGLFLDRRAFLNSYDHRIDPDGKILERVMAPIGVVCGGINLEYYFSRVDNLKLGCGTKLPHNVMGLLGVANSSDGDLRPGLPWQMIEPHDPVRLLVIVEHKPDVVHRVISSSPAMYEWYVNEWVHIAALDPDTGEFHYFRNGRFIPHHADPADLKAVENVHHLFEEAPQMISRHITHSTFENLPIYQIENTISCD
ncbi:MAG: hypothetical protein RLZZ630_1375 [Bacteroidota bacterium]